MWIAAEHSAKFLHDYILGKVLSDVRKLAAKLSLREMRDVLTSEQAAALFHLTFCSYDK